MKSYGKIETLFERDDKFRVNPTKLRNPVIGTINKWVATEKIDGTNIRVNLSEDNEVRVGGRTDNAQLHADLLHYLHNTFTAVKLAALRKDNDPVSITLYGEGYGAGIQKGGGGYQEDKRFILFDVLIGDKWWMTDKSVTEIAEKLDIPRAPILGEWSLEQIIDHVQKGFHSYATETTLGQARLAEGIVARPLSPLFDHRGKRLIIKLKTGDFKK